VYVNFLLGELMGIHLQALILAKLLETSNPHIFNSSVGVVFLVSNDYSWKSSLLLILSQVERLSFKS
jgi:hypothetical protein